MVKWLIMVFNQIILPIDMRAASYGSKTIQKLKTGVIYNILHDRLIDI